MLTSKDYFSSFIELTPEIFSSCILPKLNPPTKRVLACVAKLFQGEQEKLLLKFIEENKNVQFSVMNYEENAECNALGLCTWEVIYVKSSLFDETIRAVIDNEIKPSEKIRQVRSHLNAMKINGFYALHYFASEVWAEENRRIFDLLLDLGVDPNQIIQGNNPTALFHALHWNSVSSLDERVDYAMKLIDAGADPRVCNMEGKRAVELPQCIQFSSKIDSHKGQIVAAEKIKRLIGCIIDSYPIFA